MSLTLDRTSITLQADSDAAGRAREHVLEHLDGCSSAATQESVKLLVTELVANSVRHSGSPEVELRMDVDTDTVAVWVSDEGEGFVTEFRKDAVNGGGFGLYLVDQLADQWGVTCGERTCVWFELPSHERELQSVAA